MLYEWEIYDLHPGSQQKLEDYFEVVYEQSKHSWPLVAAWRTEIGPLNQLIHVSAYENLAERMRLKQDGGVHERATMDIREFVVSSEQTMMSPLSFSPELKPGTIGPYFEIRTYTYLASDLPVLSRTWERRIGERIKVSPVCAVWHCDGAEAGIQKLVHIWPYSSLEQRASIRAHVKGWSRGRIEGVNGKPEYAFIGQENKIVVPTAYSPLR